jgi:DNA-directed RNA polymerase specialized sigma24 family protein
MTYEEIAELHKRPVGTVKTQMRTALQKLRKVLLDKTELAAEQESSRRPMSSDE